MWWCNWLGPSPSIRRRTSFWAQIEFPLQRDKKLSGNYFEYPSFCLLAILDWLILSNTSKRQRSRVKNGHTGLNPSSGRERSKKIEREENKPTLWWWGWDGQPSLAWPRLGWSWLSKVQVRASGVAILKVPGLYPLLSHICAAPLV